MLRVKRGVVASPAGFMCYGVLTMVSGLSGMTGSDEGAIPRWQLLS